jgi:chromosome segregation ATPase
VAKKRTKREQTRIDDLRWDVRVAKEYIKTHRRAIRAEERRYKRLVNAALGANRQVTLHEKRHERAQKHLTKLKEKLQCLTDTK